jgi:hypothetical protein
MKRLACAKLAMAAVSVISKQIFEASMPLFFSAAMHERQELVVAEALAGEVDRAHREALALVRLGHEPAQRVLDHPAVDLPA